ncbi:hypothetical protein ABPG74_011211 [Tetrahymena malaccensis]
MNDETYQNSPTSCCYPFQEGHQQYLESITNIVVGNQYHLEDTSFKNQHQTEEQEYEEEIDYTQWIPSQNNIEGQGNLNENNRSIENQAQELGSTTANTNFEIDQENKTGNMDDIVKILEIKQNKSQNKQTEIPQNECFQSFQASLNQRIVQSTQNQIQANLHQQTNEKSLKQELQFV